MCPRSPRCRRARARPRAVAARRCAAALRRGDASVAARFRRARVHAQRVSHGCAAAAETTFTKWYGSATVCRQSGTAVLQIAGRRRRRLGVAGGSGDQRRRRAAPEPSSERSGGEMSQRVRTFAGGFVAAVACALLCVDAAVGGWAPSPRRPRARRRRPSRRSRPAAAQHGYPYDAVPATPGHRRGAVHQPERARLRRA